MKITPVYTIKNSLAAIIRRIPRLRGLLTGASNALRRLFGWETMFEEAGFCTHVEIIYTIDSRSGIMNIEVDTTGLPVDGITEVIVMNEQGARTFDVYRDAGGTVLRGKEIGCWDEVTAEWASFVSESHGLAFTLRQLDGARLFRGRELIGSRLAWSGFGYSFPPGFEKIQLRSKDRKALMASVLLIYPFFKPSRDRSVFRFPPLGVSYLAASLQEAGHEVSLLDCTFLTRSERHATGHGKRRRGNWHLLHGDDAGGLPVVRTLPCVAIVSCWSPDGPLPTCDPIPFLEHFDIVVRGEGEQTMIELLRAYADGSDFGSIPGIVYRNKVLLHQQDGDGVVFYHGSTV